MFKFYTTLLIAILVSFQQKDSNAQTPIIFAEDVIFPTISIGGSCGWLPPISETLTIYNYGSDSLVVTKFTFMDSTDFSLTSYEKEIPDVTFPFTVQPMDSINITVFIDPYSFCNSNGLGKLKIFNNSPQNKYVINLSALILDVEEDSHSPNNFSLSQNYPNPFNPSTSINYKFQITNYGNARLMIFNVLGNKVKDFELTEPKGNVVWNGKNELGKEVGSGVYFYKLEAGKFSQTKKMLFLK